MNDPRLPPDEAASAFLDGELGPEETEAVREHPGLAARARALRRAADAVGEDVVAPPGAADAAVDAAMADFDARLRAPADLARRRPRGLAVITGVAAAVAVGFIVAAAVGLFAERGGDDADTAAAPAPEPAALEAAPEPPPPPAEPAPAPPPPAAEALAAPDAAEEPAAETEAMDAIQAAEAMAQEALEAAEGSRAAVAAAEADLAEAQAEAAAAQAEAAAAQAEAEAAQASAADATVEAAAAAEDAPAADTTAAAPAPAPAEAPPPPAADEMEPLDDAGPPGEACAGAIGDRTVELRLIVGGTPILILGASDGSLSGLDVTTCAGIPAPDGSEVVADAAADGCAGAIGDSTVDLRLTFSGTRVLVVRTSDGSLIALDGTTCGAIPTG